MDFPPIWSFLFFFMLINLALSSICGGVQTFLAFILDEKPSLQKYVSQPWDWKITLSRPSVNPFLFIKNKWLFISAEGFSTLEKNALICYQRAMLLPIQSGVTALCR
jgi:hypothetical protein